jgi:hypothetical protein
MNLQDLGESFRCPLGADDECGSTSAMTLTVHTLHAIMDAGVYPRGSWDSLLPSSCASEVRGKAVEPPLPVRALYQHVATLPHLCQVTAAGAAALFCESVLRHQ